MLRRSFTKNSLLGFLGLATSAGILIKTGLLEKQIIKTAFLDFCSKFDSINHFISKNPNLDNCYLVNLSGITLNQSFDFFDAHSTWPHKFQFENYLSAMNKSGKLLALQINHSNSQYSSYFLFRSKADYIEYINQVRNLSTTLDRNNSWKWTSIEADARIENAQLFISENYSTVEQII